MRRLLGFGQRISSRQFAAPQGLDKRGPDRVPPSRKAASVGASCRLARRSPVGVGQQGMVMIVGRRQAEQGLEQAVDMGRGEQVAAAHDMGHALRRIVDGDGEMIAGRRVLAGEDHVAEGLGLRPAPRSSPSVQVERARPRQRPWPCRAARRAGVAPLRVGAGHGRCPDRAAPSGPCGAAALAAMSARVQKQG